MLNQFLKAIVHALLMICLTASLSEDSSAQTNPAPSFLDLEDYELIWADEFEQPGKPDATKWIFEQGLVRNKEFQYYQPQNAFVESGNLVIEGRRETVSLAPGQKRWGRTQADYTSACLKTYGKFHWQYGLLEVKAKIVTKPGLWPAIWTLGSARNWPSCGEVDLMEYYEHSLLANAVVAGPKWTQNWDAVKLPMSEFGEADWDQSFHIWQMLWDEKQIQLFVDGRLLNEIDVEEMVNGSKDGAYPFREPHYILLNLAIGGTKGGDPSETEFPSQYLIDYVRVFQQQK